jgi:hypothetical protein
VSFPDDDCVLQPDVLQQVAAVVAEPDVKVVTGQTVDESGRPNLLRWGSERVTLTRWNMFACLTEATLFVQRELFLGVGGFDEAFGPGAPYPAAEGVDLMQRLLAHPAGGRAVYNPLVRLQHPSKIPPWNDWAVSRFQLRDRRRRGGGQEPQRQPALVGVSHAGPAVLQGLYFRGPRGRAFSMRIRGW